MYKYDEKGNLIITNGYNSDGSLRTKETHKYNDSGVLIENDTYLPNGILWYKSTSIYDEKGNEIKRDIYYYNMTSGVLTSKYTSILDDKGNILEFNNYNSDETLKSKTIYKYEFDEYKNWIKCLEYIQHGTALFVPSTITEREIVYY